MSRDPIQPGLRAGRILGIPVHLHPTWFVVLVLVLWALWNQLAALHPTLSTAGRLAIAVGTTGLVFGSILMHELGHCALALRNGVRVHSIVLFVFGGVAWIENTTRTPRAEFQIAIAGPAVSGALGAIFAGAAWALPAGSVFASTAHYLAVLNVAVALFNLLPGFPLDGGRVLRALLWARGRDLPRATRTAGRVGQVIAYGLVAIGGITAFQAPVQGIWLAFIGWFVLTASIDHRRRAGLEMSLRGLVAQDLMTPRVPTIAANTSIERFAEDHVLRGDRWAIVLASGQPVGLVSRTDLRRVPRAQWATTDVLQIATPLERVVMASPDLAAVDLLQLFAQHRNHQIPIMRGQSIVGAVTRQALLGALAGPSSPDAPPRPA